MKNNFDILRNHPLFYGIAAGDTEQMFNCLFIKRAFYKKNEIILMPGDEINFIGLILSGSIQTFIDNSNGTTSIMNKLFANDIFCESFAFIDESKCPCTTQASEDTEVLWIDYKKCITTCSQMCQLHVSIRENLLKLFANKSVALNQKIEILSKRTIREKLLCYFDLRRGNEDELTIPFNREELANYLCVDRSAMSNELCKMRDEGLIRFNKNNFEILY